MSEWRGLANSEWHDPNRRVQGWAWCEGDCNTTCHKDDLCRCCLAAEVERLTGIVQRVRDWLDYRETLIPDLELAFPGSDYSDALFDHIHMLRNVIDQPDQQPDWPALKESVNAELRTKVERLTAALAESEAARTLAEGHSATLSKQLDRANMLRIRALNGLREQTKVTIDQGVALAERDRSIADLSALRHDSGEYPWHCAVCAAVHRLALRGES